MNTTSGLPPGIDLTALKGLGAEYRAITGLPLLLVDTEGRRLWGIGNCPLCALLSDSPKREKICGDHERRAVEESFRWGEPYISVCPFGLVTFAVPLSRERKLAAGLVSGFSILPQMEKDIREDVVRAIRRFRLRARVGPRTKLPFPVVPSETLRRNAALLFDLTGRYGPMTLTSSMKAASAASSNSSLPTSWTTLARKSRTSCRPSCGCRTRSSTRWSSET